MAFTIKQERELFLARVEDQARRARERSIRCFLGFLDDSQRRLAEDGLRYSGLSVRFFGGYEDAERTMVGMSLEAELPEEAYPIRCVELRWHRGEKVTHRDILGSLMGLALKRETIGDILVEPERAVVFVTDTVEPVILRELTRVGSAAVSCKEISPAEVTFQRSFQELSGTLSSLRMDCVTAFLANTSRSRAAELVRGGLVSVDGQPELRCDHPIVPGSKISIRGTGKFIYDGETGLSKKNKWKVIFRKYQ